MFNLPLVLFRGFQVTVCRRAINESNMSCGTCAGIGLESPRQILKSTFISVTFTFCHVQTFRKLDVFGAAEQRTFLLYP